MTNVALYARVSSGPQELSLEAQLRDLREHAARDGLEVVAEVRDLAEKRHMLDRPGLDEIRDLAAAGAIAEVWAVEFERFGEGNVPMLLAIELGAHGVRCRWPGDGGEGLGGEIMRAVAGVLSREEQRKRAERSRRGKRDKARRGQVLGAAPRPRFGFEYVRDGRGTVVGYGVRPEEMEVVARIFAMLAGGESIHGVRAALEGEGVDAPGGGARWSRTTIKNVAKDDVYMPREVGELAALVAEGLMDDAILAGLDPGGSYGVAYYGQTRSSYASMRSKSRKVERTPRSEWTAIPVDLEGSGLARATVEKARGVVEGNRSPSKTGDRFWELSAGLLSCADCGRTMITYQRKRQNGGCHNYYRCRPDTTLDLCMNRKSHPAEQLEYDATRTFEIYVNRTTMIALFDEAVARQEERTGLRGNMERRAALSERLSELELERLGYVRQNARGVLSDADLDAMLAEVREQRETVEAELRATEDANAAADRLRAARSSLISADWPEDPDGVHPSEFLTLAATPEEIQRAYRKFGARFAVDAAGELTLRLDVTLGQGALHTETLSS